MVPHQPLYRAPKCTYTHPAPRRAHWVQGFGIQATVRERDHGRLRTTHGTSTGPSRPGEPPSRRTRGWVVLRLLTGDEAVLQQRRLVEHPFAAILVLFVPEGWMVPSGLTASPLEGAPSCRGGL